VPTSDKQGKLISQLLMEHYCPDGIVDVGAGQGTYRDLMRYTNVQDYTTWTAVEVWEPYIEEYDLNSKYDLVINADIRDVQFQPRDRSFDKLIIFGDVLEHLPEDDARQLILRAKNHFRWILVSLPIVHAPQGEVNGNPYEAHLKHWTFDEMHEVMGKSMAFKGSTLGVFWWDSEEDI